MNNINPYAPLETRSVIDQRSSITWRSVCFCTVWVFAIAVLFCFGTVPDGYRISVMKQMPPFAYPWAEVLCVAGVMVAQAIFLYGILRPESYAWSFDRPFCALIVQILMLALSGAGGLHAPPYYSFFMLWMTICSLTLLVVAMFAAIIGLNRRDISNP